MHVEVWRSFERCYRLYSIRMIRALYRCRSGPATMALLCSTAAGRGLLPAASLRTASIQLRSLTTSSPALGGGSGGSGSQWRPRHHTRRPSPQVIRAMRERAAERDPQVQQRRQRLEPGHHHFYATCHPGLEAVVAAELESAAIGAANVHPGKAGVSFTGDMAVGYRANLWLRSAIRVLMLLRETMLDGRRPAGEEVYDAFRECADWARLLGSEQSFSVESRVWSCSNLSSSQLLNIRARDAICDAVRDQRGSKPLPPGPGRVAELPLYCTAYMDRLSIYRDMSGASLHRRGYRQAMHRASLNESAAAGILYMSGWHQLCKQEGAVLADPMCGSATFLIEAALVATNTAPGSFRRWWPFTQWRDCFDREAWASIQEQAAAGRRRPPAGVEVWGNDVHQGALGLALRDVQAAGMAPMVRLHHGECRDWVLPRPPTVVVSNPPWGQRLLGRGGDGDGDADGSSADGRGGSGGGSGDGGSDVEDWWNGDEERQAAAGRQRQAELRLPRGERDQRRRQEEAEAAELAAAWWDLSAFLKKQCPGTTAFLLSGNPEATKGLRLKADRRYPLTVGGVDCRLLQYSIRGIEPAAAADAGAAGAAAGGEA